MAQACGVWIDNEDLVQLVELDVAPGTCSCPTNKRWYLRNLGEGGTSQTLIRTRYDPSSGTVLGTDEVTHFVGGESDAPLDCRREPPPTCTDSIVYTFPPPRSLAQAVPTPTNLLSNA